MDELYRASIIGNAIILLSAAMGVARLVDWPTAILGMLVGMLLLFYISRNGTWPGVWFTGKKSNLRWSEGDMDPGHKNQSFSKNITYSSRIELHRLF